MNLILYQIIVLVILLNIINLGKKFIELMFGIRLGKKNIIH